ncbi:MAG: hypothetical protein ACRD0W_21950 [Acidimicrobiales bacterium]
MDVIDGVIDPALLSSLRPPVCVLVPPASRDWLGDSARWLGVEVSVAEQFQQSAHRRPLAQVEGRQISVVAFATDEVGRSIDVHGRPGARRGHDRAHLGR